jgi:hypothetical protein
MMVRHDQATSMTTGTGRIYIASVAAGELLSLAHQSDTHTNHPYLKVVSSGVLAFEPSSNKTSAHIMSNDGMRWLLPYLTHGPRLWVMERSKLVELITSTRLAVWSAGSPSLISSLKLPSSQGRIILYGNSDIDSSTKETPTLPYAVLCSNDNGVITLCANKHELWALRALIE